MGLAALLVLVVAGGAAALALRGDRKSPTAAPRPTTQTPPPRATASASPAAPSTDAVPSSAAPSPSASPTATTFAGIYQQVSDGVVRIETTACDGGGVGSGFLLAPDLVATVAHVVEGSVSIAVRQGSTVTTGTVVGMDTDEDLALVRTRVPLRGHVFTLDTTQPDVGTDVGAIGYPLGGPESWSKGSVGGLDRSIDVEGLSLSGLIQTDTGINPGNSGGPLVDISGTVVGLVDAKNDAAAGIGYAIPATSASPRFASWRSAPRTVDTGGHCSVPTVSDDLDLQVADHTDDADGPALADAFTTYAEAINSGDYETAYAQLSARERAKIPYQGFADGNATSFIVTFDMDSARDVAAGKEVSVRFTSVQDPSAGVRHQGCSAWRMTYTMVEEDGGWRIDRAKAEGGSPDAC